MPTKFTTPLDAFKPSEHIDELLLINPRVRIRDIPRPPSLFNAAPGNLDGIEAEITTFGTNPHSRGLDDPERTLPTNLGRVLILSGTLVRTLHVQMGREQQAPVLGRLVHEDGRRFVLGPPSGDDVVYVATWLRETERINTVVTCPGCGHDPHSWGVCAYGDCICMARPSRAES